MLRSFKLIAENATKSDDKVVVIKAYQSFSETGIFQTFP